MSEEEKILKHAESLYENFKELPAVRSYFITKAAVENDPELIEIQKRRTELRKTAKTLPYAEHLKAIQELKELDDRYQNHPLIINLKADYDRLMELLSPMTKVTL